MFNSPSRVMRILHLLRDNSLIILGTIAFVFLAFFPFASLFLTLFLLYFVLSQFKNLPLHKPFRVWGYDAFLLQYYDAKIINTQDGKQLFLRRKTYRKDYILMGYKEFYLYANELIELDMLYREMNLGVDMYENCFN